MYLLIVYDISDDKRRLMIDKILSAYGARVNLSVFEVTVKSNPQYYQLHARLLEAMKEKKDSIRIYPLDKNTVSKAEELGKRRAPFEGGSGYVF